MCRWLFSCKFFLGVQTNGLVLFGSCDSSKSLDGYVLLSDRVLKTGGIFPWNSTCSWMVESHDRDLDLQSLFKKDEVAAYSHVSRSLTCECDVMKEYDLDYQILIFLFMIPAGLLKFAWPF